MDEIEPQDGDQHQKPRELGEEEELDGGVDPVLMPPQGNEEDHGNEHDLPEDVEEEEIDGRKDADDPCQDRHEQKMKEADPPVDLRPGGDDGRHSQKGREEDQKEADPVQGQVEPNPQGRNPRYAGLGQP